MLKIVTKNQKKAVKSWLYHWSKEISKDYHYERVEVTTVYLFWFIPIFRRVKYLDSNL